MSKNTKKVIIYCRQSSGREEDSESIAFQEDSCRKYASARGMEILGVYHDANTPGRLYPAGAEELAALDSALSAWLKHHTTEKRFRSGLGEALAALTEVDYLLVYDITRLYRPVQNSYLEAYVNSRLIACKTELVSVKEGRIDFTNFTDALVSSIKSQVNDNQISLTREKAKKAMARLQDDGYYCTLPRMYGIRYIGGKERTVEVVPEQREVIRFVYDMVLKRCKYTELLRQLNTRFKGRHAGKCFYDSSWRHIIENPFYCGHMYNSQGALIVARQMQGKEIVTFEEWRKANEIVGIQRGKPPVRRRTSHPFSGLMICGHCGSRMSIAEDGGKICYSCLQGVNARHEEECGHSRVNISLVRESEKYTGLKEALAPVLLLALYKELEMRNGLGRFKRSLEEKNILLANVEAKMEALVNSFVENDIAQPAYFAAYEKLNARKAALQSDITRLTREMEASGDLERKAKEYLEIVPRVMANQLEEHEYTDLLHRSVKEIRCFYDHLEISTVYGDFTLRRYMEHKFRNLPRFKYEVVSIARNQKITDLNDCKIQVTYLYGQSEKAELIVDLSVMEIYEK